MHNGTCLDIYFMTYTYIYIVPAESTSDMTSAMSYNIAYCHEFDLPSTSNYTNHVLGGPALIHKIFNILFQLCWALHGCEMSTLLLILAFLLSITIWHMPQLPPTERNRTNLVMRLKPHQVPRCRDPGLWNWRKLHWKPGIAKGFADVVLGAIMHWDRVG